MNHLSARTRAMEAIIAIRVWIVQAVTALLET
jgi:hypothetical protein